MDNALAKQTLLVELVVL